MPRSREVVRQWQVLRSLAASHHGLTVDALAAEQGVTSRTVRRDLAALERAGFPLFQEAGGDRLRWKVEARSLAGLDAGFSLVELCALYFGRATLESLAGAPFHEELSRTFARFEHGLAPGMRTFLDRLPLVVGAKQTGGKRALTRHRERVTQLLEASVQCRKVRMRYYSLTSGRAKDYNVDPLRVVYAEGGLYLTAHVAEYGEARTFAIERIESLTVREERFTTPAPSSNAFAHSLGAFSGAPERVEVVVDRRLAAYVAEREWHPTQKVHLSPDGSLRVELHVAIDWALRRWILGFGSQIRVIAPSSLADDILDELDAARMQYESHLDFDQPPATWDLASQRPLPFAECQRLSLAGEGRS
jgi:predicted DNA-binding transcriptional regulator YafY